MTTTTADEVAEVVKTVLAAHPDATAFRVESSDQGTSGYELMDLRLTSGPPSELDIEHLADELWPVLSSLRWGAFGDRDDDDRFWVSTRTARLER